MPGVVTGRFRGTLRKRRYPFPKGMAASGIEAHGNLECAVNVPYRHNWPSTFSYFCNPGETFRASVFCGQAIDLKW
jgi:hypothetical protein